MSWVNSCKEWIMQRLKRSADHGWAERVYRDQQRLKIVLPELLEADSNCIDVGAHKGNFLNHVLKYAPKGEHLAFEPLRELYDQLKLDYPNINIYNLALSDYKGKATFIKVDNALAWSGFTEQEYPMKVKTTQMQVPVDKLDNIISTYFPVHFIKLDVEGAELRVLKGASRLLNENKPIVLFEFAAIHTTEYATDPKKIFQFFKKYGMKVYRLDMEVQFDQEGFESVYNSSYLSNYDERAETNFIACS